MSDSKVCICIPCYNNALTIGETLNSIVNQTYSNFSIKIFDNASTDETRDVVKSFIACNDNIELITKDSTVTGEENFNSCIAAAEGDYTAIFHSDDIYEPTIIADQVDYLNRNSNSVAVATHASLIDENGDLTGERMVPPELMPCNEVELDRATLINLSFKYGNFVTCPSVLFRTDILKNHIKHFNGNEFKSSADLNVWFRLTEKGCVGFLNKPLIRYRVSASSFSFNMARARIQDHDLFLVLNDTVKNCDSSTVFCEKLVSYRDFLLMKDRANTNLNRVILAKSNFQSIDLIKNSKLMFESSFHTKFYVLSILTVLITLLPKSTFLSKLIKRIKFKND